MIFRNNKINIHIFSGLISLSFVFFACSEDSELNGNAESSNFLKLVARIEGVNNTRTYQEKGPVEEGTFYMTYLNVGNSIKTSAVEFNNGVGEIKTDGDNYLEWKDIDNTLSVATFYLDNVTGNKGIQEDYIVTFTEDYKPFVAGILDTENGINDLLWGERQIARNSPVVNFQLHHCMSLVNIELTLETQSDVLTEKELDIDNAVVSISSLVLTPEKYDRQTGKLSFSDNPDYQTLILVDGKSEKNWQAPKFQKEGDKELTIYKSQEIVLPPQELLNDENRPRLSITFPVKNTNEEIIYSGVIPRAMEVAQPDGTVTPMTLAFLREYCLTLHVRLSLDPVEIIFMPVTVIDWVNKGSYLLTADQAGINDEQSFLKFIDILSNNETSQFERYGYIDRNGNWVFNLFSELYFKTEELKVPINKDGIGLFSFSMHNWKIRITDSEGTVHVISTSDELVVYLTEGKLPS